jgi:hypothetical protein
MIDPSCKSLLEIIDLNCLQNFQQPSVQIVPVNRMDAFELIVHGRK